VTRSNGLPFHLKLGSCRCAAPAIAAHAPRTARHFSCRSRGFACGPPSGAERPMEVSEYLPRGREGEGWAAEGASGRVVFCDGGTRAAAAAGGSDKAAQV